MNYRRNLMTGLIGLALLATPIAAAAKDKDSGQNNSHQAPAREESHNNRSESRSYNAPERSNAPERNAAPAAMNRHEDRDQRATRSFETAPVVADHRDRHEDRNDRAFKAAPVVAERRDWREDRNDRNQWNREGERHERRDYDRSDRDYRNYGDRDEGRYAEAPYYVMPRRYAGGSCGWARHLRNVYMHDRYTGHPAAAADLLPRLHRAERACGGVPYGYNRYHRYYR